MNQKFQFKMRVKFTPSYCLAVAHHWGGAFQKLKALGGKTGHLNPEIYKTRKFTETCHPFLPARASMALYIP